MLELKRDAPIEIQQGGDKERALPAGGKLLELSANNGNPAQIRLPFRSPGGEMLNAPKRERREAGWG